MRKRFEDVLDIINGKNQKKVENPNGVYPIYGSGGVMGYADDYLCEANTVVIGRKGSINNPIYVEEPFWNVDTAFGLTARKDMLLPRYLYFFCVHYDFCKLNTTVTIPSLTKANLLKIEMDVPDLDEQKKIVDKLDSVVKLIWLQKEQIKQLDTLIKARFVEMFGDPEENPFGWEKAQLSNVILNANNGMARRGNDEDGNIVIRLVELQDGYIDYSNSNRIILKVNGNPDNVGRCAVFHDIGEDVYHNDHIIRVHFDEKMLNGTYASALLNSDYGKRQLKGQIKTSAGQYTVSQDGIGAIVTTLPPIELQEQFAAFVRQVDKSKFAVQKALDKTQLLFDSLMQKYFG